MHKARKSLGQHFLHDRQAIDDIIAAATISPNDHMVEIGPGLGALTQALSQRSQHLDLIELDDNLAARLAIQFADNNQVQLHHANALDFSFDSLVYEDKPLRLIGNLPYNVSTPLLFHFFEYQHLIQDMLFMLQKEVVQRLVATPGGKSYGRLSVMTQYHCQTSLLFELGPEVFSPPPKVDSAIVCLQPHQQHPWPDTCVETLRKIVTLAFNQRRKTLGNALKSLLTREQIIKSDIDPSLRAEQLSVAQFVALSHIS